MGWVIFVIVLIAVISSMRNRANRARSRQRTPMTQIQQRRQGFRQAMSGPVPPGNSPVYRPGDSATYRPGNSPTYRPGDSATYRPGDSPTYSPVGAIGSRPMVAPPPASAAPAPPPAQMTGGNPRGGQWLPGPEGADQSTYATMTELATAWRDQAIIDQDQRTASRTDPQQAPYQGSTAVSGSALSTTLATPYQPTSLMTSLSSSLTTSLTDTPPRMTKSTAFAEIAVVSLPVEVAERVRFHLRNGHEVEAVRAVCDTMNVGLLEATKTVRSYGDGSRS